MDWDWVSSREKKPRQTGLTMVMDTGLGLRQFEDMLTNAGAYIDFIKLGFGTAALTPPDILKQKIALAKEHDVWIYPGGTFFEYAYAKGNWQLYLEQLEQSGFPTVEISEGTISLPREQRKQIIGTASQSFIVLSEVGKKEDGTHLTMDELVNTYHSDRLQGASYVIVEGRESGRNVGIYDQAGRMDPNFVRDVQEATGSGLLWEAPLKKQQADLIRSLGNEVNLGNIATTDVLAVEALRRGLRSDTMLHHLQPHASV